MLLQCHVLFWNALVSCSPLHEDWSNLESDRNVQVWNEAFFIKGIVSRRAVSLWQTAKVWKQCIFFLSFFKTTVQIIFTLCHNFKCIFEGKLPNLTPHYCLKFDFRLIYFIRLVSMTHLTMPKKTTKECLKPTTQRMLRIAHTLFLNLHDQIGVYFC